MMTPEKTTMAKESGAKRDCRSNDTDNPVTTPNTREHKFSCWDDEETIGKENEKETRKNEDIEELHEDEGKAWSSPGRAIL
jgi:hypothetical protein